MEQKKEPGLNQPLESQQSNSTDAPPTKSQKPPKIEEKPFDEFINEHLLPSIENLTLCHS